MEKSRIFLVGFMGSGKSTVGPLLAKTLGWDFVDLDDTIENHQGKPIRQIFHDDGESAFRTIETTTLKQVATSARVVIALGGGAFVQEVNRTLISRLGVSVFLDCRLEVILARCPADGSRPLLQSGERVHALYAERLPVYRQCDVCLDVSDLTTAEVVKSILERLPIETR
jgi:shikimate kinase